MPQSAAGCSKLSAGANPAIRRETSIAGGSKLSPSAAIRSRAQNLYRWRRNPSPWEKPLATYENLTLRAVSYLRRGILHRCAQERSPYIKNGPWTQIWSPDAKGPSLHAVSHCRAIFLGCRMWQPVSVYKALLLHASPIVVHGTPTIEHRVLASCRKSIAVRKTDC